MLIITHSPAEGTLILGTTRNDGTNTVLKANRWRWSRNLGSWYIPSSRDRSPKTFQINQTTRDLREAGFEVTVEIDNSYRPAAEVEADKQHRAAQRAEALANKAAKRAQQAEAAHERADRALHALPEGGEPIKVGHHSENRHRNAIDRAHNTLGQAIAADEEAQQVSHRAQAAALATQRRHSPVTVANRIEKLEAELRSIQLRIDGVPTNGHPVTEAATGVRLARLEHQKASLIDHLDYWKQVRDEQIASGQARNYSQEKISAGDQIKVAGMWWTVARANKKTCTLYQDQQRGVISSYRAAYAKITDHRQVH